VDIPFQAPQNNATTPKTSETTTPAAYTSDLAPTMPAEAELAAGAADPDEDEDEDGDEDELDMRDAPLVGELAGVVAVVVTAPTLVVTEAVVGMLAPGWSGGPSFSLTELDQGR
jgi:hypothetical protein